MLVRRESCFPRLQFIPFPLQFCRIFRKRFCKLVVTEKPISYLGLGICTPTTLIHFPFIGQFECQKRANKARNL